MGQKQSALATSGMWLILYKLRLSHMGSDVRQIFLTASQHRDHSILYALVYEIEFSHMGKNSGNPHLVCKNIRIYHECEGRIEKSVPRITVWNHEACRVMTNGDPEGLIFLSYPHTNDGLFFLLPTVFFLI